MASRNLKKNQGINTAYLTNYLDYAFMGMVAANRNGRITGINKMAEKTLGKAGSKHRKFLKDILTMITRSHSEIIRDYPLGERVIRFHGKYVEDGDTSENLIIVEINDVTDEWRDEKQRDILEYIASGGSQNMTTKMWANALLTRIMIMMKVKGYELFLFDPLTQQLKTFASNYGHPKNKIIRLGQSIAERSGKLKLPIAKYNLKKSPQQGRLNTPISILSVPMVIGQRLLGVVNIIDRANKYFREKDKIFYSIIANHLAIDIEYRSLLERIRVERDRLSTVISNTLHGELLLDNKNHIIMSNSAFAELVDRDIKKIIGRELTEILPETTQVLNKKNREFYKEFELTSLAGKPYIGMSMIRITEKQYENIVVTIRDITAEKRLEQLKNDFISTATHELRTPLTVILGYLSMLNNKNETLDEKQKVYIERIGKASRNLFDLVEDLLSVFRLDQEGSELRPQRLMLMPIVKELIHSLESKISNKKIRISMPQEDYPVYADSKALQRVLLNLIDNAIKYSRQGSKVSVNFTPLKKTRMVRVDIHDNGIGIPKNEQKKVFEKFHRVPNELSVEAGGTGLGLYITKKLVEQWGGAIELTKSTAKGSTFSFTVPSHKIKTLIVPGAQ